MRLICTFEKETLDLNAETLIEHSRRFVLTLANRIGLDGSTPHIGINGNWWLADKDLGVAAAGGLKTHSNLSEFPTYGSSNFLYIDTSTNKSYRWDESDRCYYVLNSNNEEIKIINGGDAKIP